MRFCIKTRSPATSLPFKRQATKQATVKGPFTEKDLDEFDLIIIPKLQWRIANGKHIFHSEISVGNLGVPFKTFR